MRTDLSAARRIAVVACWLACIALVRSAPAQQTWEYSPYAIRIWIAFDDSGELNDGLYESMKQTLDEQADVVAGAAWDVTTQRCPPALSHDVADAIEAVTVEQIGGLEPDLLAKGDKLFLVSVKPLPTAFQIRVRELDCRTRWWFPIVERRVVQPNQIDQACFAAIVDSFHAITRIEGSEGKEADVRERAGGLVTRPNCPARIPKQTVLLPIMRRNDRKGEPMDNGIQAAPWTYLTVSSRRSSVLTCQIHTGMRVALGGRSSARTEKYALAVRPRGDTTLLRVETRGENPRPLGGYEIYSKNPFTEETELLGKTDWRGALAVGHVDSPVTLLYVRNGGRLLARLPMVPGLEKEMVAQVADDDERLEVEGFVKGIQNRVMDLVARRELYKARFQRYLQNKEFDEATKLLEQFRGLESRSDLVRQLEQREQRVSTTDRTSRAKIDQLFKDTRELLIKFLDPTVANELAQALDRAQGAG